MKYLLQELVGFEWYTIQSFPTRRDAEGYASMLGNNWRIIVNRNLEDVEIFAVD